MSFSSSGREVGTEPCCPIEETIIRTRVTESVSGAEDWSLLGDGRRGFSPSRKRISKGELQKRHAHIVDLIGNIFLQYINNCKTT